jgi:microcystin-dependent protein
MPTPYIGQIIMFAGDFAPQGWVLCHGQLLPIADNPALFQLIGTTYGGDGDATFALPDLRGRVPIGDGQGRSLSNYAIGQQVGVEAVTLTSAQLPPHSHPVAALRGRGSAHVPANNVLLAALGGDAASGQYEVSAYAPARDATELNAHTVGLAGGSQPHNNLQPYLSVNYCIALQGVFPSP